MASSQGRGQTRSGGKSNTGTRKRSSTATSRRTRATGNGSNRSGKRTNSKPMDVAIRNEILLIVFLALAVILFLCNFGIIGAVGDAISKLQFGIFGIMAYIAPILIFLAIAFGMSNIGNSIATRKLVAGGVLFLLIGMICELISGNISQTEVFMIKDVYTRCSETHKGGGIIAGGLAYFMCKALSTVGTVLVILILAIICLVIVTEKSFIGGVARQSKRVYERSVEDATYRKERARERRTALEEKRVREMEERRSREEELENEKILRMDKKVSGVMLDTALSKEKEDELSSEENVRDDVHEITLHEDAFEENSYREQKKDTYHFIQESSDDLNEIHIAEELPEESMEDATAEEPYSGPTIHKDGMTISSSTPMDSYTLQMGNQMEQSGVRQRPVAVKKEEEKASAGQTTITQVRSERKQNVPYKFPPINLLKKGSGKPGGNSGKELKETALRLEQTLNTFGVRVTVTDISQGPSVTRYELQPEQGVKVSKIVGLQDDIKLNLAATDIRIEAPIPGKAAVGIEVPNKENTAVAFRDLVETPEFKNFPSNLAFAVGKDIGGQTIVTDIAKMPHMLIAGATGSGKSVCINTIIMGILYKAHPDDVKMIMIDPKVVELSVYNGIPHLLIPVVTDPKKAAAALHWGVAEMTERYKKFADFNVRDLKGYNKKVENMKAEGDPQAPQKLPQILIIVDELADLMMVSPGEVEESICRLAQLARACGIHLIIATQRPSVDVITGLIKANMPSRVAFAVSSGVDSRTILDMVGAEKLLGKGDMLFYPQGYPKPARIQGAFVSDKEVSDVVDFLKNQAIGNVYSEDVEKQIKDMGSAASTEGGSYTDTASEYDSYFADAGRFIIEKDKASIGMLQRVFKIGFNRAARIMDQLCEAGVVGEEEGTKPRKVLMSAEQFEQYIEETL